MVELRRRHWASGRPERLVYQFPRTFSRGEAGVRIHCFGVDPRRIALVVTGTSSHWWYRRNSNAGFEEHFEGYFASARSTIE